MRAEIGRGGAYWNSLLQSADGRPFGIRLRHPSTRSVPTRSADGVTLNAEPPVGPPELRDSVSGWILARILLFLLLASLPLLAISAHEFGLVSLRSSALVLILPAVATLAVVITFAPHPVDGIVGRGLIAGMVACLAYDAFRLTAVYVFGWMGDFIPIMGTGITNDSDIESGAAIGYLWRYIGDGGGLGVAFYVIAFTVGLDRWPGRPARVVFAASAFAVFPVWTGLVATVALTSLRGGDTLFHLRPDTLIITLIGHVIFGVFVGLAFLRILPRGVKWPWPSLLSQLEHRRARQELKTEYTSSVSRDQM